MHLGSILLRDRAITVEPTMRAMGAGLLVHQSADIFWAAVWGRIAAPLGRARQPATVAAWLPWSIATAAVEYYLILPWLQPLVRMEVPFWTAATVHLSSGAAYPLYPEVRKALYETEEEGVEFGRAAAFALGAGVALLAVAAARGRRGKEPRWPFGSSDAQDVDRWFLRAMAGHHEPGVELANLCAQRAEDPRLRMLGRLMLGEHIAELQVMRNWWRSWYGPELPPPTEADHEQMHGMPSPKDLEHLHTLRGREFERRFVELMVPHHEGAVEMSQRALREAADPRIRLFAQAIMHSQRGQIERMRRHA